MRETKYKVWSKKEKRFILDDSYSGPIGDSVWININELIEQYNALGYELLQYTGLKDKNGKEIYEGDIVKSIWGYYASNPQSNIPKYENRIVHFVQDNNTIVWTLQDCRDFKNKWEGAFNQWKTDEMEVIGNIYESPELLEQ
jgi:uncharacterized phage protein (TIGR01671 family)